MRSPSTTKPLTTTNSRNSVVGVSLNFCSGVPFTATRQASAIGATRHHHQSGEVERGVEDEAHRVSRLSPDVAPAERRKSLAQEDGGQLEREHPREAPEDERVAQPADLARLEEAAMDDHLVDERAAHRRGVGCSREMNLP